MNDKYYIVGVLARQGNGFSPVIDYTVVRNARHFRNQFVTQLQVGKFPEMTKFPHDYKFVAFTFCPLTLEMFNIDDVLVEDLLERKNHELS